MNSPLKGRVLILSHRIVLGFALPLILALSLIYVIRSGAAPERAISTISVMACTVDPIVTSNADGGAGSLRQALVDACVGSKITFDMNLVVSPISLTSAALTIDNNLTIQGPGAGVLTLTRSTAGGTPNFRILTINQGKVVIISGLTISNGNPGGIFNDRGNLTLNSCVVTGHAGGFAISNRQNDATLTINNSTISNNTAGAVENQVVSGNSANPTTLSINNSTISGNSSPSFGTIQNIVGANGLARTTITNSTISGNVATGSTGRGGVFTFATTGGTAALIINNSTIYGNSSNTASSSEGAGGIERRTDCSTGCTATAKLLNTIVAGNVRTGGIPSDVTGTVDSTSAFNLIGTGGSGGLTNGVNNNQVGVSDPGLASLANNGGPTQTHAPLPGSPAINTGGNASLPVDSSDLDGDNDTAEALPVDQRGVGFSRIIGANVDIGAVEVNYAITAFAGAPQSTNINTAFPAQLQAMVTESGNSKAGIPVSFTAPASGASGTFQTTATNTAPATTDGSGVAIAPVFTANGVGGTYNVTADITGGPTTSFSLTNVSAANIRGTKTVSGTAAPNGSISYTIVLTNTGPGSQSNNSGDEFTDTLPSGLTLQSASATSGAVLTAGNTVTWNGIINAGGTVTITINANVNGNTSGTTISNQGTINYDTDGNGTNDSNRLTDDPGVGGASDPTSFLVCSTSLIVTTNADSGAGSLRQAIINACSGATITFDMNQVVSPITLTTGQLLINKNLTINGPGANQLVISGNTASRVFSITEGSTVTITDLTIANGRVTGSNNGAGVLNSGALTLTNCNVYGNNNPTQAGGGIYTGSSSNPNAASLTLNNCNIGGTTAGQPNASGASGGGIFQNTGTLLMTGGSIVGNSGDGIAIAGTATLNGVAITNNTISSASGAGMLVLGTNGTATIVNCLIANNTVTAGGGGGIHVTGTVNMINSTISGNVSGTSGGGVNGSNGNVVLTNVTITNNRSGSSFGGGISLSGAVRLNNTIVAGNFRGVSPSTTADDINGLLNASSSNNLIGVNTNLTGISNGSNGNQIGTSAVPLNALLGLLGANGGPTQTHALLPGSPAINAGANSFITNPPFSGPPFTDQRGSSFDRIVNTTVDIGAFESRGFTIVATSGTPQSAAITTAFASPLVATVSSASGEPVTGGIVTFTAPASGSSATFNGAGTTFNAAINATGQASTSATANAIAGGPYAVNATGAGIASAASFSLTNNKASTNTAVSSSVNPSDFGQGVTFTATVTSGAGTPSGTVQFKDNGTNLGSAVALNGSGAAQFSTSALTTGTHTITADYSGDANFLAGTGTLSGGQVVKAPPSLSISDVATSEGDSGTKTLDFTVTLSAASNLTVSANYATANGTATSGSDYVATNGTLTFNPGVRTMTIGVTINGDVSFEPDETFTVSLSTPVNATISRTSATGTIANDDFQGGLFVFSPSNYSVSESTGFVTVTLTRTNDVSRAASVDYATRDLASSNCGTLNTGASSRCDYTAMFGTFRFAPNETQKTLTIPINRDGFTETPEVFRVQLSNLSNGSALTVPGDAVITITDSQSPTPNPLDDSELFVRQHYHDFLNREADPPGLAFWKDNIDLCNDPARRPAGQTLVQCLEVQRITTSASFFLSIEFRQTGGMVRDFYVAALDRPATNNMPNFAEFMRDSQAIQSGVIVGQGNWQAQLDANRAAFMNDFVTRPEFVGLYPTTDAPTQYVDKLYLHANVSPGTPQERTDAINEFGGAAPAGDTGARARALLRITQNAAFQAREISRGFVQMEYFGYLRRNPNDAPDNNFDGYNFWLNKLNQFNGDFLRAEMVKAFLSSLEYRGRFGP